MKTITLFSDHALERMRSRNLTTDQIKEAIKNPDEHFHPVSFESFRIKNEHRSQGKTNIRSARRPNL